MKRALREVSRRLWAASACLRYGAAAPGLRGARWLVRAQQHHAAAARLLGRVQARLEQGGAA